MLINMMQLVVARYSYDPFGNILSKSGPMADASLYRLSGKETHPASGLVCFLYRFYEPNLQRWPNRDPLGESSFELLRGRKSTPAPSFVRTRVRSSGSDLYGFVHNQPLDHYDALGLAERGPGTTACQQATEQAEAAWTLYDDAPSDGNLENAIVLSGIAAYWWTPPPPPKPPWWKPCLRTIGDIILHFPVIILDPC